MTNDKAKEALPFVPELDLFTKNDNETERAYIRNALITRLSRKVTDAYMAYTAAVNEYESVMRLIEAYRNSKANE